MADRTGNREARDEADRKIKEVRAKLREAETEWSKEYLSFKDDKQGWRRLKQVSGLKRNEDKKIVLRIDDKLENDPAKVAEHFNRFFIEKVDKIAESCPPDPAKATRYTMAYTRDKNVGRFSFSTVNFATVKHVIKNLKNTESTGLDRISVKTYKRFKSSLVPAICKIVNSIITQSYYPVALKSGILTPVPKKHPDPTSTAAWRPIILVPILAKIVEGCLSRQLKTYLERRNLLPFSQHSYRRGRSTISCWQEFDLLVNKAKDDNMAVGVYCSDLTSAFNTVSIDILIPKLRLLGVSNFSLQLVASYLTGRNNRTRIDNYMSYPRTLNTGSGEGTASSPLWWLIYIIDAPEVLRVAERKIRARQENMVRGSGDTLNVKLYDCTFADDVNTIVVGSTNQQVLEFMKTVKEEFGEYFSASGLKESAGKACHILFTKGMDSDLHIGLKPDEVDELYKLNGVKAETEIKLLKLLSSNTETSRPCVDL